MISHQSKVPSGVWLFLGFFGMAVGGWPATLHVWQDRPSAGLPYDSWATAAHVIQDAVDAAVEVGRFRIR